MKEKELKSNIEALRKDLNLTQVQLAQKVGVTHTTVRNWEKGRTGLEIFELVARVCEALECHPRDLIDDKDDKLKRLKKIAA
jgi:transcriptional regulator with XRE-family HTH domain